MVGCSRSNSSGSSSDGRSSDVWRAAVVAKQLFFNLKKKKKSCFYLFIFCFHFLKATLTIARASILLPSSYSHHSNMIFTISQYTHAYVKTAKILTHTRQSYLNIWCNSVGTLSFFTSLHNDILCFGALDIAAGNNIISFSYLQFLMQDLTSKIYALSSHTCWTELLLILRIHA